MANDNKTLGRFVLDGIPPAPRGVPQIEVTFDIDANGILNVSAKDKATNKEQSIRIEGSSGLSKEEVDRMKQDASQHAEEDRKKKDAVEAKNLADQLIFTTEKTLTELGDKVPADAKKTITDKIDDLKKVKDGSDIDAIKKATADLSQAAQKIGEQMYKNASPNEPSSTPSPSDPNTVVEGQAEEKSNPESKQ